MQIFDNFIGRKGFPDSSVGKKSAWNAVDPGLISGWKDPVEKRKGYPLQYSDLENSMYSPWGHKELDTTEWLSLVGGNVVGLLENLNTIKY